MRGRKVKYGIRKGDTVVALSGESRGRRGKVLRVYPRVGRVLVEGMNQVKKHMRKSQEQPQGGIVEREAPMAISNVRKVEKETA